MHGLPALFHFHPSPYHRSSPECCVVICHCRFAPPDKLHAFELGIVKREIYFFAQCLGGAQYTALRDLARQRHEKCGPFDFSPKKSQCFGPRLRGALCVSSTRSSFVFGVLEVVRFTICGRQAVLAFMPLIIVATHCPLWLSHLLW